jgi:two-component system NtrC family sensor kinase
MDESPRILLIDDNSIDRARIIQELEREFPALRVRQAGDEGQCAEALRAGEFDLVLLDYLMPWTDGLTILRTVKTRFPDCPVIMVTGSGNEELAVEAIKAGLDDYVLKTPKHLARLPAAVRASWEHAREHRALEAAESLYRNLFDRVPVGLYRASPDGKFLEVNPALVEMLGYPGRDALLTADPRQFCVPAEDRAHGEALPERDGIVQGLVRQFRRRDGSIIWVRDSARAVRDAAGRIVWYEGSLEDITEQRRAEELLASHTAQLETIRTVTEEITRELNLDTVIGIIGRRALELVGGTSGGVFLWDDVAQRLVPRFWHGHSEVFENVRWRLGEGVVGTVAQRRHGMVVNEYRNSPYAHPLFLAQAGITAVIAEPLVHRDRLLGVIAIDNEGIGRNFTEDDRHILSLFAAQAAVAIENARLFGQISHAKAEWESTFDAAADFIAVLDPDYRIVRVNWAMARKFHTTPQALIGRRCHEVFEGFVTPPPECPLAECLRTRRSVTEEWEMPGSGETHLRTYSPFLDPDGNPIGVILVSKDMTDQKRLQQQLLHAEKMAAMGRLVSGVAHELNNPLTAVFGHAQLLLLGAIDEVTRQRAEVIVAEAERAAKIVRNLLSFARPQKPERRVLAIESLVEETLALRAYELNVRSIRVVKELEPDLPPVLADRHQLQQVLLNFLINAEQAISQRTGRGEIHLRSATDAERTRVRVAVEDDGPGIPPDVMGKIFDPFFTTKEVGQGTGLGLSICYTILEEHGGRIRAGNRPQGGAWFEFELPAYAETRTEPGEVRPSQLEGQPTGGMRILVADDEEAIVRVVVGALGMQGHSVDVALDGRVAAERVERDNYDLVLMDLKMPGFTGQQLYEVISRKPVRPHVVIMTGDTISPESRAFLAKTGLRCLEKPFNIEDLWSCVRQFSRRTPPPPEDPPLPPPSELHLPLA